MPRAPRNFNERSFFDTEVAQAPLLGKDQTTPAGHFMAFSIELKNSRETLITLLAKLKARHLRNRPL